MVCRILLLKLIVFLCIYDYTGYEFNSKMYKRHIVK